MTRIFFPVLVILLLISSPLSGEEYADEPFPVDVEYGFRFYLPPHWEEGQSEGSVEILRYVDEHNNALFSLYRYELTDVPLHDFAEYFRNYYQEQGWEIEDDLREKEFLEEEGYELLLYIGTGEDQTLMGKYIFFSLEDKYFMGRFLTLEEIWDDYSQERDIIFNSLRPVEIEAEKDETEEDQVKEEKESDEEKDEEEAVEE